MPTHPEASFVEFGHLVKPITTKEVRNCLKGVTGPPGPDGLS